MKIKELSVACACFTCGSKEFKKVDPIVRECNFCHNKYVELADGSLIEAPLNIKHLKITTLEEKLSETDKNNTL